MGDKVDIATAETAQLMTIPGVGSKRAAAIIQLRESEESFKMQALVSCTNIKQNEWARLYQDGVIDLDLPQEELQIPGNLAEETLSPSSRRLKQELEAMQELMKVQERDFEQEKKALIEQVEYGERHYKAERKQREEVNRGFAKELEELKKKIGMGGMVRISSPPKPTHVEEEKKGATDVITKVVKFLETRKEQTSRPEAKKKSDTGCKEGERGAS